MSKAEEKALKIYPAERGHMHDRPYQREGFIAGYHQAEKDFTDKAKTSSGWNGFYYGQGYRQAKKDLIENKHEKSWRLDKQLWSGFKNIEEASYQYIYDASNDWAYEIPTWGDVQDAFKAGAEWKESLELTWEDIKTIDKLLNQCVDCNNPYQEVLKQFKNYKERKEE